MDPSGTTKRPPRILGSGLTPPPKSSDGPRSFGSFSAYQEEPPSQNPSNGPSTSNSSLPSYQPAGSFRRHNKPEAKKKEGFLKWAFKRLVVFSVKHALPLAIGATVSVFAIEKAIEEFKAARDRSQALKKESKVPPVKGPIVRIKLRPGETLSDLILNYTGEYNAEMLNQVLRMNPNIKSADLLSIGQEISLPDNRSGVYELDVVAFEPESVTPLEASEVADKARQLAAAKGGIKLAQDDW